MKRWRNIIWGLRNKEAGIFGQLVMEIAVEERSQQIESLGCGLFDSFHLVCAEASGADIFLSTDDRLLKTARRHELQLKVAISNPVVWLISVLQEQ